MGVCLCASKPPLPLLDGLHPRDGRCADSSEHLNSSEISFPRRKDAELLLIRREAEFLPFPDDKRFKWLSFQLEVEFIQE